MRERKWRVCVYGQSTMTTRRRTQVFFAFRTRKTHTYNGTLNPTQEDAQVCSEPQVSSTFELFSLESHHFLHGNFDSNEPEDVKTDCNFRTKSEVMKSTKTEWRTPPSGLDSWHPSWRWSDEEVRSSKSDWLTKLGHRKEAMRQEEALCYTSVKHNVQWAKEGRWWRKGYMCLCERDIRGRDVMYLMPTSFHCLLIRRNTTNHTDGNVLSLILIRIPFCWPSKHFLIQVSLLSDDSEWRKLQQFYLYFLFLLILLFNSPLWEQPFDSSFGLAFPSTSCLFVNWVAD